MLSTAISRVAFCCGLPAVLLLAGCSDSGLDSSFVYNEGTRNLIPEAQNGLKDVPGLKSYVDERFGNPQQLKAWLKLPIDFGGTQATVSEYAAGENGTATLTVAALEGQSLPKNAPTIQFLSGACSGSESVVTDWDQASGKAVLASAPQGAPVSGDSVTIDGGSKLKSGRVLYMRHCSHCHGTSGDGAGPTAQYLNPRPRDYRHGIFKFTSTNDASRVSRDDLTRILKYGIPGTYMPSFLLMKDEEISDIVEYVRFLTMRGDYERRLVAELSADYSKTNYDSRLKNKEKKSEILDGLKETLSTTFRESAASTIGSDMSDEWAAADTPDVVVVPSVPRVPDSPESRRRGRELYLSKELNCADCHGVDAGGNGPQTIAFEKNPVTGQLYADVGLHDVWDNPNQPRNLKYGIYRGGRRPIDLFRRIHAGIKGSRMPSFKNTPHEDIWHVVNYVLSIPFETEPGASGTAPQSAVADAAAAN